MAWLVHIVVAALLMSCSVKAEIGYCTTDYRKKIRLCVRVRTSAWVWRTLIDDRVEVFKFWLSKILYPRCAYGCGTEGEIKAYSLLIGAGDGLLFGPVSSSNYGYERHPLEYPYSGRVAVYNVDSNIRLEKSPLAGYNSEHIEDVLEESPLARESSTRDQQSKKTKTKCVRSLKRFSLKSKKKKKALELKKEEALESKKEEALESKKEEALESKKEEALKSKKEKALKSKTKEALKSKKNEALKFETDTFLSPKQLTERLNSGVWQGFAAEKDDRKALVENMGLCTLNTALTNIGDEDEPRYKLTAMMVRLCVGKWTNSRWQTVFDGEYATDYDLFENEKVLGALTEYQHKIPHCNNGCALADEIIDAETRYALECDGDYTAIDHRTLKGGDGQTVRNPALIGLQKNELKKWKKAAADYSRGFCGAVEDHAGGSKCQHRKAEGMNTIEMLRAAIEPKKDEVAMGFDRLAESRY